MFVFIRQHRATPRKPPTRLGPAAHRGSWLFTLLLVGAPFSARALQDHSTLRGFLEAHEISVSDERLTAPLEDALIQAIDPRATFLTAAPTNSAPPQADLERSEFLPGNILYCLINGLNGQAAPALDAVLTTWTNGSPAGLILDIRQAGGTQLDDVDAVASLLLGNERPLYRIRNGAGRVIETRRTRRDPGTRSAITAPVILLTGKGTRGAGEVLAASLAERPGIMLVGTPTNGDSGLRETLSLPDGRLLYMATRWVDPVESPRFQETGVRPDLNVADAYSYGTPWLPPQTELTEKNPLSEKAKLQHQLMQRVSNDAVLGRAADILIGLHALNLASTPPAREPLPGDTTE